MSSHVKIFKIQCKNQIILAGNFSLKMAFLATGLTQNVVRIAQNAVNWSILAISLVKIEVNRSYIIGNDIFKLKNNHLDKNLSQIWTLIFGGISQKLDVLHSNFKLATFGVKKATKF